MAVKENNPISLHQFMIDNKVGRDLVTQALKELHITSFSFGYAGKRRVPVLSSAVQNKVQEYLRIIPPDERQQYHEDGFVTAKELGSLLRLPKTTTFKYLHAVDPDWEDTYPSVAQGQRRIVLLPPEIIDKVARYHKLGSHRRLLGIWHSLQTRNALPVYQNPTIEQFYNTNHKFLERIFIHGDPIAIQAYVNTVDKLPTPSPDEYAQMTRNAHWFRIAKEIIHSQDIIPLDATDHSIFQRFSEAAEWSVIRLSLHFAHLPIQHAVEQLPNDWGVTHQDAIITEGFRCMCKNILSLLAAETPITEMESELRIAIQNQIDFMNPNPVQRISSDS